MFFNNRIGKCVPNIISDLQRTLLLANVLLIKVK